MAEESMNLGTWGAIIGVILSLSASSFSAMGNVMLKWSHENNLAKPPEEQVHAFYRCHWWSIYLLYVGGGLFDTASFAFAPMSLLAPTSGFTIIVNMVFARMILGEEMTNGACFGSGIIICGAVLTTIFGSKESHQRSADELKELYRREGYIHYQIINVSLLLFAMLLALVLIPWYYADVDAKLAAEREETRQIKEAEAADKAAKGEVEKEVPKTAKELDEEEKAKSKETARLNLEEYSRRREKSTVLYGIWVVCYAFMTSCFGSMTNIFMKSAVEMFSLTIMGGSGVTDPFFAASIFLTLISALFQFTSTVYMMCTFPAIFVVPVYQCMFIIALIVSGGNYFQEFDAMGALDVSLFSVGCLVCFIGIVVVAVVGLDSEEEGEQESPPPHHIEVGELPVDVHSIPVKLPEDEPEPAGLRGCCSVSEGV